MDRHPLDRAIWASLTSRQAPLGVTSAGARRFLPEYALFAALDEETPENLEALAALITAHGPVAIVEAEPPPEVPGTRVAQRGELVQMICEALAPPGPPADFAIETLGEADAPQMLALATLTRPGPFFARTHELGEFIGVKVKGQLAAMAGERLKPAGFTEVSGVCTHPDHRGRGYAGVLSRLVAQRIVDRGETPFLHAFADNPPAIRLYETLGFRIRARPAMTVLATA
ncbi:MAG: GNAT family N-acetyltransferase [Phenylobacterium sp.]